MTDVPHTRGPVIGPEHPDFDTETAGYNRLIRHRPALVVGATGAADVISAVRFAGERGMPLAVQATGHGPAVPADGAVLVNTRRMTGVRVDAGAHTARIEAGVRSGQLVHEAAAHGLAPLNGSAPEVGAVSYTLSGGIPLLGRRFGYAADHVRALDVVTADGQLRQVSAESDGDLFWALRGGGGNFGVVVSMEVDLVPLARLYGGGLFFPADATADVLHTYRSWARSMPEQMGSSVLLIRFPDAPALPEALRAKYVSHVRIEYAGPADEGERWVRPLRAVASPLIDTVRDMPYREVGSIHQDPTAPAPFYARTMALRALERETVDAILRTAGPEAGAPYLLELRHLGGALSRPPAVPNAAGRRDAEFNLYSGSLVTSGELDRLRAAHDALHATLVAWATGGVCLNFLTGPDATQERVRSAYLPADYARLAQLKRRWDPDNMFRINHNIAPAGASASM